MSYLNSVVSLPPNREPGTISDGRATPDPQKDFVLTSLTQFPSAQSFGAAIGQDAARLGPVAATRLAMNTTPTAPCSRAMGWPRCC